MKNNIRPAINLNYSNTTIVFTWHINRYRLKYITKSNSVTCRTFAAPSSAGDQLLINFFVGTGFALNSKRKTTLELAPENQAVP